MAPIMCSYFQCRNKQHEKPLFRFPINEPKRLDIWLLHCGNMTITHLPVERLRYKCLCIDHFDKKFVRDTGKRARLTKLAIPQNYRDTGDLSDSSITEDDTPYLEVLKPEKVYKKSSALSPESEDNNEALIFTQQSRKLSNSTKTLKERKGKYKPSFIFDEEREEGKYMAKEYLEWEEKKRIAEMNKARKTLRANQLNKTTESTAKETGKKRRLDLDINETDECTGYECSGCTTELTGGLSWCLQCSAALCAACERSHAAHYVLRAPPARPPGELERVIASIRPVVEHIVEATATPTSMEVNTDPLLLPKEEPDDEEISFEIEEKPTQLIYPNVVGFQTLDSKHTVTSATQSSEPDTSTQPNTPSPSAPSTSALKSKRALSERVHPKRSVGKTTEKPPVVSGSEKPAFDTATSSSILTTQGVQIATSRDSVEIPSETSAVIKEEVGDVGAEDVNIKEEEDSDISKYLVFTHNVKKETDEPS